MIFLTGVILLCHNVNKGRQTHIFIKAECLAVNQTLIVVNQLVRELHIMKGLKH